jgi:hypothetical protein
MDEPHAALKAALTELKAGRNNAMAVYVLADLSDPVPDTSPIANVLNAGLLAWIPYRDPLLTMPPLPR